MAIEALERWAATWEEYQALGEDIRAEYVDGEIVITPSPSRRHQNAVDRLKALLLPVLPSSHTVTRESNWKPQGSENEYIPDLCVHPETDEVRIDQPQVVSFGIAEVEIDLTKIL